MPPLLNPRLNLPAGIRALVRPVGKGLTAMGGNTLLKTLQHALGGPEHTGQLPVERLSTTEIDTTLVFRPTGTGGGEFAAETGGSGLTVEDEGAPLATAATTLDFVGAGVTASGTGATKVITIPGGGGNGFTLTKRGAVLSPGTAGAWDAYLVESPCVFLDEKSQRYAMVYVGYNAGPTHAGIGLAWSEDLITWTKDAANPILAYSGSGPDSAGCTGPFMYQEGGTYYLFYIGLTATGYEAGTKTMCLATATSLTGTWTRLGTIIAPSGSGWRSTSIWHPNVLKVGSTYYNFFNASGAAEYIGYATATSLTGTWTVDDVNSPLLSPTSGWESNHIGDPHVFPLGDAWFMAYYGYDGTHAQDGYAWTTQTLFPLGWTRWGYNPLLTYGAGGSIDSEFAHKPAIFMTAPTLYHFYTAYDGTTRQIALATSPLPVMPQTATAAPSGAAAGDLGGSYPNPTVTSLAHATAGGDLSGTMNAPTVAKFNGVAATGGAPSAGMAPIATSPTAWAWQTPAATGTSASDASIWRPVMDGAGNVLTDGATGEAIMAYGPA